MRGDLNARMARRASVNLWGWIGPLEAPIGSHALYPHDRGGTLYLSPGGLSHEGRMTPLFTARVTVNGMPRHAVSAVRPRWSLHNRLRHYSQMDEKRLPIGRCIAPNWTVSFPGESKG